jgi:NAD(P)-dependent dehydrogenase (short-subunit alcohol dehydrogenase family)
MASTEDALKRAAELRGQGLSAGFMACDVSRKTDVDALVDHVLQAFGRIDVLVNNAGIFKAADFLDVTEEDFDAVINVNIKGSFLMGQAAARAMKSTGGGAIVNMSSVNAVMAIPNIASYNVSKGGINQLTRAMSLALADFGIRVNAVAPGYVKTALVASLVDRGAIDAQAIARRTPMGRMAAPEEIAQVIAFLASPLASYITGAVLPVDGGWTALGAPEAALGPLEED